jgi:hypothetical protein
VNELITALTSLVTGKKQYIILGDFNFPNINWATQIAENDIGQNFLEFANTHGLKQVIDFPTRENNFLDILLMNDISCLTWCEQAPPFSNSDHSTVEFSLQLRNIIIIDCNELLDFNKSDFHNMNIYLSHISWFDVFSGCIDVADFWNKFKSILKDSFHLFIPKRNKSLKKQVPIFLRKLQLKKLMIWRKYKKNPSVTNKTKLWKITNDIKTKTRTFICEKEERIISSGNIKDFYAYVKSQNVSKPVIPPLYVRGTVVEDDYKRAVAFNNFFQSVFIHDDSNLPDFNLIVNNHIENVTITPEAVYEKLLTLSSSTALGPDKIPNIILKRCAESLAQPLSIIFEVSLRTKSLPDDWLTAIICPIFKNKGNPANVENYRPISLTSTSCKVFEKIMKDKLLTHFFNNKMIHPAQHGFLSSKSTGTQLLECVNKWTSDIESKNQVDVIYIDFAKAFDSVSHSKLIYKLSRMGVSGNLLAWLETFVKYRRQCVRINGLCSEYCTVSSGVPQGSVLGPILFLVYVNDLTNISTNDTSVKLFADDVKLFRTIKSIDDHIDLQLVLNNLKNWAATWQLKISTPKCSTLQLGRSHIKDAYKIGQTCIPVNQSCSDLGILISPNLKFSDHIQIIKGKALRRCHLIFRFFRSKNIKLLTRAYKTYVRPILEYNSYIWSPYLLKDIDAIESVQRYFTRRLLGSHEPYTERLNELGFQSLEHRRVICDLVMCYKIVHGHVDLRFEEFFTYLHAANTRGHSFKLYKKPVRLDITKHFFSNRIVNLWNSLPENVVNKPSVLSFKSSISNLYFPLRGRALEG